MTPRIRAFPFPLGSVKDHLGSIIGVQASSIEVMFDGIGPSSFGILHPLIFGLKSYTIRTGMKDDMRRRYPNQRSQSFRRRYDAVGSLARLLKRWFLLCCCQNTHAHTREAHLAAHVEHV